MKKLLYGLLFCLAFPMLLLSSCDEEDETCKHKNLSSSVVLADCDSEGYTLQRCEDCGFEYRTDVSPSKGHTLKKSVQEATCTKEGHTTYTCECGYTYQNEFVPPLTHSFEKTVHEPTCIKQGYTEYVCKICDYSYEANYLEPKGHTLVKQIHAPTCTEQGYTEYTCTCGYSYQADFVKPLGHTITTQTTAPTCEEQGFTTYACSACSYSYTSDYVEPNGHDFTTSITKLPTGTENGEIKFSCDCGYTYTNLILKSDVFEGAYVDGTEIVAHGIDVSYYQEEIDWDGIKAAGIDYVIIRAGYTGSADSKFETHYAGAKAAGLDVGSYFYSYATSVEEILEDAALFLELIEGKQFEYPVYLDLEDPSQASLDASLLTEMCTKFINTLQDAGYFCGLYVNWNWLMNILETETITTYFDVWVARYYDHTNDWKAEWGDCLGMWQYSDQGVIGEYPDPVDVNVCFKDYPGIIKSLGFNGFPLT